MKELIIKMFSDSGEVSIKRVIAFEFTQLVLGMVVMHQWFNKPLDFSVLVALLSCILTLCGINAAIQMKGIDAKKSVAKDMVNSVGDTDAAQETLQAPKPGE